MGHLADVYLIKKSRSKELADRFLHRFFPKRKENAEGYVIPRFSDFPEIEFQDADAMMAYLEAHPTAEQAIYWSNLNENHLNRHGMVFYTSDACMIFGISRNSNAPLDDNNERECLEEMITFFASEEAYITYECPPAMNYTSFIAIANQFNT